MSPAPVNKPLVTFALLSFNQQSFIREAVDGAISQDYSNIEIIISDDCSVDATYEIIRETIANYKGCHRVIIRQNKRNLGIAAHLNEVVKLSKGEIIILAAGDDISLPNRTSVSVDLLLRHPGATAILLSAIDIDSFGKKKLNDRLAIGCHSEIVQDMSDLCAWRHVTFGATRAFRRRLFDIFGPLSAECPTEDTPLLVRSLIVGYNVLSYHKGVLYRIHDNNLSSTSSLARMDISKIYGQYQGDLDSAKEQSLINADEYRQLQRWLTDDWKIRSLRLCSFSGCELSVGELLFAMTHRGFAWHEKVRFLRNKLSRFWI